MPQSSSRKKPAPTRKPGARVAPGPRRPAPPPRSTKPWARWVAGLVVLGLIGALILTLTLSGGSKNNTASNLVTGNGPSCTTDTKSDPGRNHVTNPTYLVNPPAGGDHYPEPASAGIYITEPPSDGQLVHSLEHGYVILWFDPTTEVADLKSIEQVANQFPRDTLVVPRTGMSVPLAATAWHQRVLCQGFNQTALVNFIAKYRNQGPEKIPH